MKKDDVQVELAQVNKEGTAEADGSKDAVNNSDAAKENNLTKLDSEEEGDNKQRVATQTLITFGFAIMLHSLIDGLAIGVFKEASEMLVLSASVIIHKIPVACTVGTTFKSNG